MKFAKKVGVMVFLMILISVLLISGVFAVEPDCQSVFSSGGFSIQSRCTNDTDCDDGNPCTLDKCWCTTSCTHTIIDKTEPDTDTIYATRDNGQDRKDCEDGWMYVNFDANDIVVNFYSEDKCSNLEKVGYIRSGWNAYWTLGEGLGQSIKSDYWYSNPADYWEGEEYRVCGRAKDTSGNQENVNLSVDEVPSDDCCMLCIDKDEPDQITNLGADIEDCTENNVYSNSDEVTWTWTAAQDNGCAGIKHYEVVLYDSDDNLINETTTDQTEITFYELQDGEDYYVVVSAVDNAGNEGNPVTSEEVIIDLTKPGYSILSPEERWFKEDFTVEVLMYDNIGLCECSIKVKDINDYEEKVYEKPCFCNQSIQFSQTITIGPEGDCYTIGEDTCKVWAYVKDKAGNKYWQNYSKYSIDYEPPTTTKIVGEPIYWDGKYVKTSTPIYLSCDDGEGSGCKAIYYRKCLCEEYDEESCPGNWTEYPIDTIYFEEESCHVLEYYSVDNIGNTETVKNQTHYVDETPPETEKWYEGPEYWGERLIQGVKVWIRYISDKTKIILRAEDPEPHPVGVNSTWWTLLVPSTRECGEGEFCFPEAYLDGEFYEPWEEEFESCIHEAEEEEEDPEEYCNITWWEPKWDYMEEYCEELIGEGEFWPLCVYTKPIQINQSCDHKICYFSVDHLGNGWPSEEDPTNIECQVFSVDNEGPEIIIHNPGYEEADAIKRCDQSIVVEVYDLKSGVNESTIYVELWNSTGSKVRTVQLKKVVYNGTKGDIYEGIMDKQLPVGNYTLKVYAKDNLGNSNSVSRNENLAEGIYVEYLDPASCIVNMQQGGNCSFTFHTCIRGANAIKMWMDKLGEKPGLITPDMLNAKISKNGNSTYVGLLNVSDAGLLQLSANKINGKGTFDLKLTLTPNITSLIGTGIYNLDYYIEAYDP